MSGALSIADTPVAAPSRAAAVPACAHCGSPCRPELVWSGEQPFCCGGCAGVFALLHQSGLEAFYAIERTPGLRQDDRGPVDYSVLADETVRERVVEFSDGRLARVRFRLPAIHCVACVWLLEHLHQLNPGVGRVEVRFTRREAMIQFDEQALPLPELALLLDRVGYPPELHLDALDDEAPEAAANHRLALQLGVAGFAFGNIMLLAFPSYLGLEAASQWARGFAWIQAVLSIPVVTFCARDYFRGAWLGLQQRHFSIDLPIALGVLALFLHSIVGGLLLGGEPYFDSLAGLVFFLLIGRWFQQRTYDALSFDRDYRSFFPLSATVVDPEGTTRSVALDHLEEGDRLRITHGEIVPADAVLCTGEGHIDYHFVTGESAPVDLAPGQLCQAGGRQVGAAIEVELRGTVRRSYLASLWDQAVHRKDSDHAWDALTDRVGQVFTGVVLVLALLTALAWLFLDPGRALWTASAVLIVACPCALALAGPFAFGNAMRVLAKRGLHVKNAGVVEAMSRINHLVFDKTGTLTASGEDTASWDGAIAPRTGSLIRTAALQSSHPVSWRLAEALADNREDGEDLPVASFEEVAGEGSLTRIGGHEVRIGRAAWAGVTPDADTDDAAAWVTVDGDLAGRLVLRQGLRPGLREALEALRGRFRLDLLSGDHPRLLDTLQPLFGDRAGFRFRCRPHEKAEAVAGFQQAGGKVMMVGDGLNDAGALRGSDVGVAVSDDLHRFSPACDVLLQAGQLRHLPAVLDYTRRVRVVVVACFGLSFAYNLVGLSLAASGTLSPLAAAVLMPTSSITVVAVATVLTRWTARRLPPPLEVPA